MDFEWDEQKDLTNQDKHGISFREAVASSQTPASLFWTPLAKKMMRRARKRLVRLKDVCLSSCSRIE